MRDDAVVGQRNRLDPSDRHAAVGDIGVLVQAAAGHEVRLDLIGADAQRGGHVQVEDRDRADREHRDDREDRQLKSRQPVEHSRFPGLLASRVPGGIWNGSAACPDRLAIPR